MTTTLDPAPPTAPARARTVLVRALVPAFLVVLPALVMRIGGLHTAALGQVLVFGAAVVAASFLLAWAAEAAEVDVSGGLAVAVLAFIAVLPEYAVDLYYAYTGGSDPAYEAYAAANMTGSNRLLLGLGWPVVVLVALWFARRATGRRQSVLRLEEGRLELGFLLIAGIVAFVVPLTAQIHIVLGVLLIAWFVVYLYKLTRGEAEEPDLVGVAAAIGGLPKVGRRWTVVLLFVVAAAIIVACAEPFADSLVEAGGQLGVDQFLLVQWLAPLASEAPEFIVAIIFATRGKGGAAMAMLISAKVNQWTLLVGSLPIAYTLGGGHGSLPLDGRQVEEVLLTATQTLMGVAILLALRFQRWAAVTLLVLFAAQFAITSTPARLVLSAVYAVIALVMFVVHRRQILPTLRAPFARDPAGDEVADVAAEPVAADVRA